MLNRAPHSRAGAPIDRFQAIQVWLIHIKYNIVNWLWDPPDRYLGSDCRQTAFGFAISLAGHQSL
jgi:hypothetical protein